MHKHIVFKAQRISLSERIILIYLSFFFLMLWRLVAYRDFWQAKEWVIQTDKWKYANIIDRLGGESLSNLTENEIYEVGYLFLSWILSNFGLNVNHLVFLNEILFVYAYFRLVYFVASENFYLVENRIVMGIIAISFLLITPFFHAYSNNIIRQSISTALVIISMVNYLEKKRSIAVIFFAISILFHYASSLLCLMSFIFVIVLRKANFPFFGFIAIFIISVIFYYFEVSQYLSDYLYRYVYLVFGKANNFVDSGKYVTGFKVTFLVASIVGFLLALFCLGGKRSDGMYMLFGIFCTVTSIYMMLSRFDYYDRVAITSWILVPLFAALVIMRLIFALIGDLGCSKTTGKES